MHIKAAGGSVWELIKKTYAEWTEDKAMKLAAALALYTILSLAPLLVISVKVLTVVLRDRATGMVESQMQQLVGTAGADAIQGMINSTNQKTSGVAATIASFAVLLFSASYVFAELQDSMNVVWEVKPKPDVGWWDTIKKRFFSMAMVFGVIFLLLVSMLVTAALGTVVERLTGTGGGAEEEVTALAKFFSYVTDALVTTLVVWALFTLIFKYLPDVKIDWRDVWLGGLVTAVLFKIGQYALAAYFYFFSTTSAYGAAGSLVAVLLWAYYSSMILFFGAEFTQVYAKRDGRRIQPDEDSVKITAEDRAQRGIPRPAQLEAKTAEQEGRVPQFAHARGAAGAPPGAGPANGTSGFRTYLIAAGALGVGAAGAWALSSRGRGPTAREAAAARLADRMRAVEERVRRVSRLRAMVEDVAVSDRVREVERRIRHARTALRAKETGRPKWLVLAGDWLAGNRS